MAPWGPKAVVGKKQKRKQENKNNQKYFCD
jgi:hypothetical protein